MARLLKILCFIALNISCKVMATIVTMEELFNAHIKQTVLLNGDVHLKESSQKEDLLAAIKKNKAYSIIEGGTQADDIQFIGALALALKQQKLASYNPEFRKGMGNICYFLKILAGKKYTEFKELYHTEDIKDGIGAAVLLAHEEGFDLLKEIAQDLAQLKTENFYSPEDIKMLCIELDEIGALYNEIRKDINIALPKKLDNDVENVVTQVDRTALANFVFADLCVQGDNDQVLYNPKSLITKIFEMSIKLFDMRTIVHILNNKQEPAIFVCAGRLHTDNIARVLQKLGYVSLSKMELDVKAPNDTSLSFSDLLAELATRPKLNVQEFIAASKTLK